MQLMKKLLLEFQVRAAPPTLPCTDAHRTPRLAALLPASLPSSPPHRTPPRPPLQVDTQKLPLGKLSKQQLSAAYAVLAKLHAAIGDVAMASAPAEETDQQATAEQSSAPRSLVLTDLSNQFYTLVPSVSPVVIDSPAKVEAKAELGTPSPRVADHLHAAPAWSMPHTRARGAWSMPYLRTHFAQSTHSRRWR